MNKALKIAELERIGHRRKPGYAAEILRIGTVKGDTVELTPEQWQDIRARYGLLHGEVVHSVLGPIGKFFKWPCLKGDGTTDLKPNSPCDNARKKLNQL